MKSGIPSQFQGVYLEASGCMCPMRVALRMAFWAELMGLVLDRKFQFATDWETLCFGQSFTLRFFQEQVQRELLISIFCHLSN